MRRPLLADVLRSSCRSGGVRAGEAHRPRRGRGRIDVSGLTLPEATNKIAFLANTQLNSPLSCASRAVAS